MNKTEMIDKLSAQEDIALIKTALLHWSWMSEKPFRDKGDYPGAELWRHDCNLCDFVWKHRHKDCTTCPMYNHWGVQNGKAVGNCESHDSAYKEYKRGNAHGKKFVVAVLERRLKQLDPDYTSYEGCVPYIRAIVSVGNHCLVEVRDTEDEEWTDETIVAYMAGHNHPYLDDDGSFWRYAREIEKPKHRVKTALSIMQMLIEEGYLCDSDGEWANGKDMSFSAEMWHYCGKAPTEEWTWRPRWLEKT